MLELATIGGARALGLDATLSVRSRPGKQADLAAFPLDGASVRFSDPVSAAVFSITGARARFVSVAGQAARSRRRAHVAARGAWRERMQIAG